jgi:RecA-family ATPase
MNEAGFQRIAVPESVARMMASAQAQRLAVDDAAFKEAARKRGVANQRPYPQQGNVKASVYQWIDPAEIAPREWIFGRSLIRKFLTVTVAPGGVGKSSLTIAEALSLATGRDILNKRVERPSRVWLWNLEDPYDELQRRIQAACWHYGIQPGDLGDRFFVDSGRDHPLRIALAGKNGTIIQRPVVDGLIAEMRSREIDVLIVDPFVSSHGVSENDNGAMDAVAKEWATVADQTNAAVHLVHHTRKLGSDAEVTAESSRGGKALTDAAREVRAINRMSADEGEKFSVENHRSYFRMFSDKANMAPPAELSDWYEIKNVVLPNGDHVGVVTAWKPPGAFDDVNKDDLHAVQKRIHESDWRKDIRSDNWAGKAIAEVLGLDASNPAARQKVKSILHVWIENGALVEHEIEDGHRKKRIVVRVGEWVK